MRIPFIILMGAMSMSTQAGQLTQEAAGDSGVQGVLLEGPASGAGRARPCVHCEHSKLVAQDADPLGEGAWQLQFNAGYSRSTHQWDSSSKRKGRDRATGWNNQEVLTYGVSDDLDLGIGLGFARLSDDASGLASGNGVSDLALSSKWRFFQKEEMGVAWAYVPTLTIPTGKSTSENRLGPSQEFWSLDTRFAVVKDWLNHWSMNGDIGYVAAFGDRGDARGSFGANGAVGYRLLPWLQPEVELNYGHHFIHADQDADLIAVTVGAGFPISDLVCARAGLQRGIAGRYADQSTVILLSVDLNF